MPGHLAAFLHLATALDLAPLPSGAHRVASLAGIALLVLSTVQHRRRRTALG